MQILLYIGSIALCYFFGLKNKKTNTTLFVLVLSACLFLFIMHSALNVPDGQNYYLGYESADGYYTISSSVLRYIQAPFFKMGVPFPVFKAIIYIAFLALLSFALCKSELNYFCVLFLFLISVSFTNIIQIRNFCAMCLLSIGLLILLKQKKHGVFIFFIFYLLSCLFHNSFLVYAIFLLPLPKNKQTRRFLFVLYLLIFLCAFVFLFFSKSILFDFAVRFSFVDDAKMSHYASSSTNLGPFIVLLIQLFTVVVVYCCLKKISRNNLRASAFLERLLYINILSLSLCCFALLDLNFYRLIRNIVLLNFAGISLFWKDNRSTINFASILSIAYSFVWLAADVFVIHSFEQVVIPFFI